MKKTGFLIVVLFTIIACSKDNSTGTEVDVTLGNEFALVFNETRTFSLENMRVKFSAIEDKRCPKFANCLVPGWANATFEIRNNSGTEVSILQIGDCGYLSSQDGCFGEEKEILGYRFQLINIYPYPDQDYYEDELYVVKLVVTK